MRWRIAVAALFVIGEAGLVAADFGAEDGRYVVALALALPFVAGLLIGRWWALCLALTHVLFYVIDPGVVGELAPWFALTGIILVNVPCLALGIGVSRGLQRVRAHRADPPPTG